MLTRSPKAGKVFVSILRVGGLHKQNALRSDAVSIPPAARYHLVLGRDMRSEVACVVLTSREVTASAPERRPFDWSKQLGTRALFIVWGRCLLAIR